MTVAVTPDERLDVDLVDVDEPLLCEGVGELATSVHEQITVDLILQPRDRDLEVALEQRGIPPELVAMGVLLGSGLTDPEKVGLTGTIESFVPTLAPILDGVQSILDTRNSDACGSAGQTSVSTPKGNRQMRHYGLGPTDA